MPFYHNVGIKVWCKCPNFKKKIIELVFGHLFYSYPQPGFTRCWSVQQFCVKGHPTYSSTLIITSWQTSNYSDPRVSVFPRCFELEGDNVRIVIGFLAPLEKQTFWKLPLQSFHFIGRRRRREGLSIKSFVTQFFSGFQPVWQPCLISNSEELKR